MQDTQLNRLDPKLRGEFSMPIMATAGIGRTAVSSFPVRERPVLEDVASYAGYVTVTKTGADATPMRD